YSLRQFGRYLFVERPQVICGHGSEAVAFHRVAPKESEQSALTKRTGRKQALSAHSLRRTAPVQVFEASNSGIQAAAMKSRPLPSRPSGGRFASSGKRPCLGLAHLSSKVVKFSNALGHQLEGLAKNC
ncbi:hypothetical protein, partial [Bradyrhizobium sp. BRP19]|uniref:hypothetical protein n=1 Tax=Bradyrhizobium sp. BRP19 TaxID=2793823 RepID=UPI001CD5E0AB